VLSGDSPTFRGQEGERLGPDPKGPIREFMPSKRIINPEVAEPHWPLMRIDEITEPDAPAVYGILQAGPHLPDGIPYVRPAEIQNDKINVEKVLRTSPEIARRYRRSALKTHDVILSIVGTIGKVALVPSELEGGNINQSAVRIRPRSDIILPEFLAWVLRSPLALRQYAVSIFGSAVMRLNVAHVRALKIPVPPIKVQRQIVSQIENQLTRLAAATNLLRRVQASLDRYRASIFRAACEGKLVVTEASLAEYEGRDFVDARATFETISRPPLPNRWTTRSRAVIQGHAALAVGNPQTPLPPGWIWVALTDIAEMHTGHTPSRSNPSWWNGEIPWLGLADASRHDGRVINDTTQHTNPDGLANSAARLLPAGTICVSRTASVGYVIPDLNSALEKVE
jgi:type I restriction enzyme, S subunit